ncbi:MAG TPA: hypothetical protein VF784_17010 [Anaerolineales bacterium]
MSIKVEYLLAAYFGRAQRWSYRRGRGAFERRIAESRLVGQGGCLGGLELRQVQDFAATMWFRAAVTFFALTVAVEIPASIMPRGSVRAVLFAIVQGPMIIAGASLVQVIPIVWRRNWTGWSANRRMLGLTVNLREERRGLPRARDFWVALMISCALWVFVYYGSTHWNH